MSSSWKRRAVWGIVLTLAVLHYDFWYWTDKSIVFGFMPIGLFFHAMISVAAGITWALVVKYAWPTEIEAWASIEDPPQEQDDR